jgi:Rrf2 family protein
MAVLPRSFVNISMRTEYALRAVFDLALQPLDMPVKIGDIAKRQSVPHKFLQLILADLKQAGLVESRRGVEGGYLLARPPESIRVGDVTRLFEAPRNEKSRARRQGESPFSDLWRRLNHAVSGVLDQTSFADLRRAHEESQTRYVPDWVI